MTNDQIFDELRRRNITKVVVAFSGGNDEGGADGFTAHYTNGTEQELPVVHVYVDYQTQQHVVSAGYADGEHTTRPATPEEIAHAALLEALEQPIFDRWGGFSGDFHVDGTLTWDPVARTAKLEGSEGEMQYESFEDEL